MSHLAVSRASDRVHAFPSGASPFRCPERPIEVPPHCDGRIHQAKAEARAGRRLFLELEYDAIITRMVKLSGADIAEIIQRALEEKVRLERSGQPTGLVSTEDIQKVIQHRRTKEVVDYGQYL